MRLLALKTRTGRMKAGEYFDVNKAQGRILVALGHAKPLPPEEQARMAAERELEQRRIEYLSLFGHEADKRWGLDRVKEEIALVLAPPPKPEPATKPAAKSKVKDEEKPKPKPKAKPKSGEYERRDMKAKKD